MSTQTIGRKSKELLVVVVVLNVAVLCLYGFLFREIKLKNEHISTLINQIETEGTEESIHTRNKMLVTETATLREKLLEYTIGKDGTVTFIGLLEKSGREVGVEVLIDSVVPKEVVSSKDVETLRFALKATGSWSSVVRFLGLLELLPYESDIENVVVSKSESVAESPWVVNLVLLVLKDK